MKNHHVDYVRYFERRACFGAVNQTLGPSKNALLLSAVDVSLQLAGGTDRTKSSRNEVLTQ